MLRNGRGVLCAPITIERCNQLGLEHQVQTNTSMLGTPFTVTVDLLEGCTTGVSCHDRAATIVHWPIPIAAPKVSVALVTSIRSMHKIVASWRVQDTPKQPLTWLVWQVCNPLLA